MKFPIEAQNTQYIIYKTTTDAARNKQSSIDCEPANAATLKFPSFSDQRRSDERIARSAILIRSAAVTTMRTGVVHPRRSASHAVKILH